MKVGKTAGLVVGALFLVALILWSGGFFDTGKIPPGQLGGKSSLGKPLPGGYAAVPVAEKVITDFYEAVGTVRPRTETKVEAQVTAKIEDVLVRAGDLVKKGQLLIKLDSRELRARLEESRQALQSAEASKEQARRAIDAAKAAYDDAKIQYQRMQNLYAQKAVAKSELDSDRAIFLQAEAEHQRAVEGLTGAEAAVRKAKRVVEQAEINMDYTEIKALEDGEVSKRSAELGDLAYPNKSLLYVQTGGTMRLEALVREGLINKVRPGTKLPVVITALDKRVEGTVEEVVPSGDPRTRTFVVKVGLPDLPGLYPGMFGRLLVPMGERKTLVIPKAAVKRVGQLETVGLVSQTKKGQRVRTIYVRTGLSRGDLVEILGGLKPDEIIATPAGAADGGTNNAS